MNIHQNQTNIRKLLKEGMRKSATTGKNKAVYFPGCYIISQDLKTSLYKLGEAHGEGGLYTRITHQYKICMPLKNSQFYLHYIVICPREQENGENYSHIMETALKNTIASPVEDSYSVEYIFNKDINFTEERTVECLTTNREYFRIAIKFNKNNFQLFGDDHFEEKLYDFDELSSLNTLESLLSLYQTDPNIKIPAIAAEIVPPAAKAKTKAKASAKSKTKKTIVRLNERPERTNKKIPAKLMT